MKHAALIPLMIALLAATPARAQDGPGLALSLYNNEESTLVFDLGLVSTQDHGYDAVLSDGDAPVFSLRGKYEVNDHVTLNGTLKLEGTDDNGVGVGIGTALIGARIEF